MMNMKNFERQNFGFNYTPYYKKYVENQNNKQSKSSYDKLIQNINVVKLYSFNILGNLFEEEVQNC